MRPQQQNRRMRGRGNNNNNNNNQHNRKGPNPLSRNYESNGPDVKIRGSAQQVAEKYLALARDAQSSGDRVMAENYLQHAEHYNRIILAAQAQLAQQLPVRESREEMDDDSDDDRDIDMPSMPMMHSAPPQPQQPQPQPRVDDGSGPQPVIEGMPAEVALEQDSMPRNGGERANGAHADREGQEQAPRRARRPRRDRRERAPAEGSAGEGQPAEAAPEPAGAENDLA